MKEPQMRGEAQVAKHSCDDHTNQIWHNTEAYNYISCSLCNNILKFRFKSILKHLKMTFWGRIK